MSGKALRMMFVATMFVSLLAFCVLGVGCSSSSSSAASAETQSSTFEASGTAENPSGSAQRAEQSAPDKNGFDKKTNFIINIAGVDFQIPSYFEKDSEDLYFVNQESGVVMLQTNEFAKGAKSEDEFHNIKLDFITQYIDGLTDDDDSASDPVIKDMTLAGYPATLCSLDFTKNGVRGHLEFVFFYNSDSRAVGFLGVIQSEGTQYDYFSDFDMVLSTAMKNAKTTTTGSKAKRDYEVTIDGVRTGSDYSGNPVVIVTFSWTNNSKESAAFAYKIYPKCFQNGVECDLGISMENDSSGYTAEVKPGYGTTFELAYSVKDDSDVTIEISPLVNVNKEVWVEQTFSLS